MLGQKELNTMKDKLIYCVELNEYFVTTLEAKRKTGVDASSIGKACRGERLSAGKHPETGEPLHWQYRTIQEVLK
jgi:hypothetical protein